MIAIMHAGTQTYMITETHLGDGVMSAFDFPLMAERLLRLSLAVQLLIRKGPQRF